MRNLLIAVSMGLAIAPTSYADFKYKGVKNLIHDTQASFEQEILPSTAFAKDTPLETSLQLLVGDRIQLDLGNVLDRETPISWRGGRSRGEVLGEIVSSLGAQYWYTEAKLIVRSQHEIDVSKRLGLADRKGRPIHNVIWKIPANTSVKQLFTDWVKLTPNAQLDWQLKDHQDCKIKIAHSFEGLLEDAVQLVVKASNSQPGCSIPYAKVWGNNVLQVTTILRGNYQ